MGTSLNFVTVEDKYFYIVETNFKPKSDDLVLKRLKNIKLIV